MASCNCCGRCGCSQQTANTSGSGGEDPVNPDGSVCTDPGIADRVEHVIGQDENFCFRRTRAYKVGGSTDPSAPFANAFFTQSDDGTSGFTNQPCVDLPDSEFYQYGPVTIGADSHMVRKDGCEFDATGQPGVPGVWYWDGSSSYFAPPGNIGIETPDPCAILGTDINLAQGTTSYLATVSSGISFLAADLTANLGVYEVFITEILDSASGLFRFDLITTLTDPFVLVPAGTSVCPVGFKANNELFPVITGPEMATGPSIVLQLPTKELRRMSPPPTAMSQALLSFDFTNNGLRWVDQSGSTVLFPYQGSDIFWEVPAGVTSIAFFVWGAGGADETGSGGTTTVRGGVGGFVSGRLAVTPGDPYVFVIGQGGNQNTAAAAYGFGGAGQNPAVAGQRGGGGLSGVFTGAVAISATDTAKAVLVAGGGGAAGRTNTGGSPTPGGNGGDPGSSGGQPTMQGIAASGTGTGGQGGGGGGYTGGGTGLGIGGKGGSNFVAGGVTNATNQYAVRPSITVPGSGLGEYPPGVGLPTANGAIFLVLNG